MKNILDSTVKFPSRVPVMVLPNALLLPHVLLPLHIFEERYRAMLDEALARDRMICVALMKAGIAEIREVKSEVTNEVEAEALSAKLLELSRAAQNELPDFPEALARNLDHLHDPGMLADIIAHVFVPDPLLQQKLLAQPSVSERLRALIQLLRRD